MDNNIKNKDGGRLISGLILVVIGGALLLRNMGVLLPGWLFTWPMILIVVGIHSGFKHNFKNNGWIVLIGIGSFFLISNYIPTLGLQPFFWPVMIIGLGLLFILRPDRKNLFNIKSDEDFNRWKANDINAATGALAGPTDSNDFLRINSVFSGVKRNILSKNFQGGRISSVFGGAEIDLTQADIAAPVVLRLEIVFGGVKLIVPAHWAIQNEIDGVFHGVDDKRTFTPSTSATPAKVLILKGSAVFGGIEIKSY